MGMSSRQKGLEVQISRMPLQIASHSLCLQPKVCTLQRSSMKVEYGKVGRSQKTETLCLMLRSLDIILWISRTVKRLKLKWVFHKNLIPHHILDQFVSLR